MFRPTDEARRHVMAAHRAARPAAGAVNEKPGRWNFVSDALFDGWRIQALTVMDDDSRGKPRHRG
jgi:hypothetical protein